MLLVIDARVPSFPDHGGRKAVVALQSRDSASHITPVLLNAVRLVTLQ